MKTGNQLILLNTKTKKPTYRALVQTSDKLPAPDLGLGHIQYPPDDIRKAMPSLLGEHIWDESMSSHRANEGGKDPVRFGKVVNQGYCPEYGGYVDLEVFDPSYVPLMDSLVDSVQNGLPTRLGISTEIPEGYKLKRKGDTIQLRDFEYKGLVLTDFPRDKKAKLCSVVNNSLKDRLEDNKMTDEFKMSKEEYDNLKQVETDKLRLESELATLRAEKVQGKADWLQFQQQFNDLKTEKEDLFTQLVPVWTQQGEQKLEMVNSILETIPEAEKEAKKAELEKLGITELGIITNSLPTPAQQGHGVTGGSGTGRTPPEEEGEFTNDKYLEICEKHGIKP